MRCSARGGYWLDVRAEGWRGDAATLVDSTADIRKKATDAYGQASQTVNEMVSKGREAVDRGRQAFDSARQSATEGNFGQSRQNASDFGSGPRPSSQAGV